MFMSSFFLPSKYVYGGIGVFVNHLRVGCRHDVSLLLKLQCVSICFVYTGLVFTYPQYNYQSQEVNINKILYRLYSNIFQLSS